MSEENKNNPTGKPELDDIFAADDELPNKADNNINITQNSSNNQTEIQKDQIIDYEDSDVLSKIKKYLAVGLVLIALFAVVGAGFYFRQPLISAASKYLGLVKQKIKTPSIKTEQKIENKNETNIIEDEQNLVTESPVIQNQSNTQVEDAKQVDSDNDGLTDEEERNLGTSINSIDSDSDGLFDREEVKVYKTNPLNRDTDGDGIIDGDEIKMKRNPLGEGTLEQMIKK